MRNQWQKRQTIKIDCPSGNEVIVRRPGPDLAIKAGKFARVLQRVNGKANADEQLAAIEQLPDTQLEQLMEFARIVLCDVVIEPPLYLNPKENQLSPDDVPLNDFWFIHIWAMNGGPTMPVKTKEGETTVEAVETFPVTEGSGSAVSLDGEQIQ